MEEWDRQGVITSSKRHSPAIQSELGLQGSHFLPLLHQTGIAQPHSPIPTLKNATQLGKRRARQARTTSSSLQPAGVQEYVPKLQLLQEHRGGTELFHEIPSPQPAPKDRINKAQGMGLGDDQWVLRTTFPLGLCHHSKQRALGSKDSIYVRMCTLKCVLYQAKKNKNKPNKQPPKAIQTTSSVALN